MILRFFCKSAFFDVLKLIRLLFSCCNYIFAFHKGICSICCRFKDEHTTALKPSGFAQCSFFCRSTCKKRFNEELCKWLKIKYSIERLLQIDCFCKSCIYANTHYRKWQCIVLPTSRALKIKY